LFYLAHQPERIDGGNYKISSDIWSFGLVALELAIGIYPYFSNVSQDEKAKLADKAKKQPKQTGFTIFSSFSFVATMAEDVAFWQLLERIVKEAVPLPKKGNFSNEMIDFLSVWYFPLISLFISVFSLKKEPNERMVPQNLLVSFFVNNIPRSSSQLHPWLRGLDDKSCLSEFSPFIREAVRPKDFQF
jgi:serine/threonine protein kinase